MSLNLLTGMCLSRPETLPEYNEKLPARLATAKEKIRREKAKREADIKKLQEMASRLNVSIKLPEDTKNGY